MGISSILQIAGFHKELSSLRQTVNALSQAVQCAPTGVAEVSYAQDLMIRVEAYLKTNFQFCEKVNAFAQTPLDPFSVRQFHFLEEKHFDLEKRSVRFLYRLAHLHCVLQSLDQDFVAALQCVQIYRDNRDSPSLRESVKEKLICLNNSYSWLETGLRYQFPQKGDTLEQLTKTALILDQIFRIKKNIYAILPECAIYGRVGLFSALQACGARPVPEELQSRYAQYVQEMSPCFQEALTWFIQQYAGEQYDFFSNANFLFEAVRYAFCAHCRDRYPDIFLDLERSSNFYRLLHMLAQGPEESDPVVWGHTHMIFLEHLFSEALSIVEYSHTKRVSFPPSVVTSHSPLPSETQPDLLESLENFSWALLSMNTSPLVSPSPGEICGAIEAILPERWHFFFAPYVSNLNYLRVRIDTLKTSVSQ